MLGPSLMIEPALGFQRILQEGKFLRIRTLAWILVLCFAIVLPFGLILENLSHALPKQHSWQFLAHIAGALTVLAAYYVLVLLGEKRKPSEISLSSAPFGILAGLSIGFLMFSLVMAILIGTGVYAAEYHGVAPAWRAVGLAVEAGVLEETIVRGVILRLLWRSFGPLLAFIVSSILFGAGHIGNPTATVFSAACIAIEAGIMLGAFYALTGRLWVSIGVHAGWNFTQGYVFGAAVSGGNLGVAIASSQPRSNFPVWLSGGAFGPEASLPALLACSAVGGGVMWLAWRKGRFLKDGQTVTLHSKIGTTIPLNPPN